MSWKKKCLREFRLYAVTDLKDEDLKSLEKILQALRGGVDMIQLRSKTLNDRALIRVGKKIRMWTRRMKKAFIVNDRIDLMKILDADGVHLGQHDIPIKMALEVIKDCKKIIGQSTHSLSQAVQAESQGADYIGFGPIFDTPTKPTYPPIGLNDIASAARCVGIPVVCIGGIDQSNIRSVIQAGAQRVAVVRSIFSSTNPCEAAKKLKEELLKCPSVR